MQPSKSTRDNFLVELKRRSWSGTWGTAHGAGLLRFLWQPAIGALLLVTVVAVAMMLPFSSDFLVESPASDLANHVSAIIEARNAFAEGQFPLRVAPNQNQQARYPLFQFYGNLPYTVGGLVYLVTDINPYWVWKLTVLFGLIIGGFFTYRCGYALTDRAKPSMVAGVVFITAPYLLSDINARFAYTETISFTLLPAVLFYSLRTFTSEKLSSMVSTAIVWSCLALSHNITFLYGSIFFGLYFLSCFALNKIYLYRIIRLGVAYTIGVLMCLWYIIPQMYLIPFINVSIKIAPAYDRAQYAPLYVLLSPILVLHPEITTPRMSLQVGWPIIASFVIALYYLLKRAEVFKNKGSTITRLIIFFGLAFFMAWSPVDFWKYLPYVFSYVQFPYRILMFVVLWGSLLTPFALVALFKENMRVEYVIGITLVLVTIAAPFLPVHKTTKAKFSVANDIIMPNTGRGGANDIYRVSLAEIANNTPLVYNANFAQLDYGLLNDHWLRYPGKMVIPAPKEGDTLLIEGMVSEHYSSTIRLKVTMDDVLITTTSLPAGPFKLNVPLRESFDTDHVQLEMQTDRYLDPEYLVPGPPAPEKLAFQLTSLTLQPAAVRADRSLLLSTKEVLNTTRYGVSTISTIKTTQSGFVQLPVLFYPNILRVRDNGQDIPYSTIERYVAVSLPPGEHIIDIQFIGVTWANIVSGVVALAVLAVLMVTTIKNLGHYRDFNAGFSRPTSIIRISAQSIALSLIAVVFCTIWFAVYADFENDRYDTLYDLEQKREFHLNITFLQQPGSNKEPVITTGRVKAGDFVYVRYLTERHLAFGFNHWGVGGPQSEPIEFIPHHPYNVEILMDRARREVVVKMDGQVILWHHTPFYPTLLSEVTIGENRLGGTGIALQFSGSIVPASGAVVSSSPKE
jgi:hypothetical protein